MAKIVDNPRYILRSPQARDIYSIIKNDPIFDVHTHIDWRAPFARSGWDLLKYHYFTEMAYSQGLEMDDITKEKVKDISEYIPGMRTTAPYWWLVALSQKFFDGEDNNIGPRNWERFNKIVEEKGERSDRVEEILQNSNIERIGLTNSPCEALGGMPRIFLPTFRVDSLLDITFGQEYSRIADLAEFEEYISSRFRYFVDNNARSAAVSLPPLQTTETRRAEISNIFERLIKRSVKPAEADKFRAHILNYLSLTTFNTTMILIR